MLSHFMGPVFETMAAQYVQVRIHRGSVPFLPQHAFGKCFPSSNT
ncbi:hypothetical protein [Veillonella atypica]|nr:hypothetical protein [Veillonella atypica]